MAVAAVSALVHIASMRRLAAALAVVALTFASVGNVAHRAAVRHVACEHGELVELAAPTGHDAAPAAAGVSTASAHGHHHCALDGFHAPAVQRSIVSASAYAHAVHVAVLVTRARGRDPLAYAPKTSPPV